MEAISFTEAKAHLSELRWASRRIRDQLGSLAVQRDDFVAADGLKVEHEQQVNGRHGHWDVGIRLQGGTITSLVVVPGSCTAASYWLRVYTPRADTDGVKRPIATSASAAR